MKKSLSVCALLISILIGSFPASADTYPPSPYCTKPSKPYSFSSQFDVDQYKRNVERYKDCLQDFVEKQEREKLNHKKAAENAIEEWNDFVRYSR